MSSIFGVWSSYMLEYHWLFALLLRSARYFTGVEGKWVPLPPILPPFCLGSYGIPNQLIKVYYPGQSKLCHGYKWLANFRDSHNEDLTLIHTTYQLLFHTVGWQFSIGLLNFYILQQTVTALILNYLFKNVSVTIFKDRDMYFSRENGRFVYCPVQ